MAKSRCLNHKSADLSQKNKFKEQKLKPKLFYKHQLQINLRENKLFQGTLYFLQNVEDLFKAIFFGSTYFMSHTLLAGVISWCWNDWKYPIGFDDLSVCQSVSQWVPKLAIFSGPYLRIHLSYIIEIWYSLQDGWHKRWCIISALYLKWVPSCRVSKLARNGSCK